MEGRSDVQKQIESLKKTLLQEELSEKISSDDICSMIGDLTRSITSTTHKPNSHAISNTIEVFVQGCSHPNHVIRGAAAEHLKRLLKKLMGTHFARIQQDLFHELKKNGSSRSLCVVLECFGALFPLTRPLRCSSYAQSFVPVLVELLDRKEEPMHEVLQEAFSKILPILTPFMNIANLKVIMRKCLEQLPLASPSYRRMAATFFTEIGRYSKKSFNIFQWIVMEFLDLGTTNTATDETVKSILIIVQQFFSNKCCLALDLLKKLFCFIASCVLHMHLNTVITGLECLQHLLQTSNADFSHWLTSSNIDGQVAINFWSSDKNETEKSSTSLEMKGESEPVTADSARVSENCFLMMDSGDDKVPLKSLINHLLSSTLSSKRVSAQSLVLVCISYAVDMMPTFISSLDMFLPFITASDPKLRSSISKLLAHVVQSNLRIYGGEENEANEIVSTAFEHLYLLIDDDTSVVVKSVCEALQICLPSMVYSTMYDKVLNVVNKLVQLANSSYWLTKVELLQTLHCLDFTVLSLQNRNLAESIYYGVILDLLDDSDHRVRSAACDCLVSLVKTLSMDENLQLANAKKESKQFFSHLDISNWSAGFNSIAYKSSEHMVLSPAGLDFVLWNLLSGLSSTEKQVFQRGCLEALHTLTIHFPPIALPEEWGCSNKSCSMLKILDQFLQSSKLAWSLQTHCYLLDISSSMFLSCTLAKLKKTNTAWGAIGDESLALLANNILYHNIKLLSLYVHVIEGREPDLREKKVQMGSKKTGSDALSPMKQKQSHGLPESVSSKPRLVPRDGIGYFANSLHYMKLLDACKAAYTNYEISLGLPGSDQFSKLLITCHKSLSSLLEVALARDIGQHVEEILLYLSYTVRVDASGALLCVQQLLNSLFGMNLGAQQTHIYSPFISSLPYGIGSRQKQFDGNADSLYSCLVLNPLSAMKQSLHGISATRTRDYRDGQDILREYTVPLKEALTVKPVNSVSDIKDYISYFEPLVVYALNQFPYTSSLLLQERVLFLVIQLLQLKVRYDLLDCNHTFFETVMKLIGIMESGMVRGGEGLVPYLFQFLVLLSVDQSKLVTVPQVMQMCDGVMASGQNVTTFAVPALQPLVLYLFVRKTSLSKEIETQREVAVNMLLRLIENSKIIILLIHVLDYYKEKHTSWNEVSNRIYQALMPSMESLKIQLETKEGVMALYQLFMAMDLEVYDFQEMLTALLNNASIDSSQCFLRWLSTIFVLLQVMCSKFSGSAISRSLSFVIPEMKCHILLTKEGKVTESKRNCESLAAFIMETLSLSIKCLYQAYIKNCVNDYHLLPSLIINILLLLLQTNFADNFKQLHQELSDWKGYESVSAAFLKVSTFYPLLALHFINFLFRVNLNAAISMLEKIIFPKKNIVLNVLQDSAVSSVFYYSDDYHNIVPLIMNSPYWKQNEIFPSILKCISNHKDIIPSSQLQVISSDADANELISYIQVFCQSSLFNFSESMVTDFLCHCLSVVGNATKRLSLEYFQSTRSDLSASVISEVDNILKNKCHRRCSELVVELRRISRISSLFPEDLQDVVKVASPVDISKEWYLGKVKEICSVDIPEEKWRRVYLLSNLEKEDILNVFATSKVTIHLLEECISIGLKLTRSSRELLQYSVATEEYNDSNMVTYIHPLLEASINEIKLKLTKGCHEDAIIRCSARLLSANHEFSHNMFSDELLKVLAEFCLILFKESVAGQDPLRIQNSMECCATILCNVKKEIISEEIACGIIHILYSLFNQRLQTFSNLNARFLVLSNINGEGIDQARQKMFLLLNIAISREVGHLFPSFHHIIEILIFRICRLPMWHNLLLAPPLLKKEVVTDRLLDEALKESEVLKEYMQRCNSLGWLSRALFEERWMQLLGVINQPMPSLENVGMEAFQANCINISAGIRAITSLLCGTMLCPVLGDPTSSFPITHHRNPEMIFLGSGPGQKYTRVRKILEHEMVLAQGSKKSTLGYYQYPVPLAVKSYSSLYSRNIEREIGVDTFGYGQISVQLLWKIISNMDVLLNLEDIDIKSCILSLVDLYSHWLTQPVNRLLLKELLISTIILSDLFTSSDQFKWMLSTFMELHEIHPLEDTSVESLVLVGILKATAVLKLSQSDSEGQIRLIEKALGGEIAVQTASLEGILFLSEDPNNNVIANCIPFLSRYISQSLLEYSSFSEDHLKLIWSVTVVLVRDYHQYIKEQMFIKNVLDSIIHLMNDTSISPSLFHSLCYGLEFMILNFSLSSHEKASVFRFASNWYLKGERSKSVASLSLLLVCMYTGEEVHTHTGIEGSSLPFETAIQAREQVNNLIEKLRHGSEINTDILVDILPHIITDFLSPMEVLQTVVTDFISPHQNRPEISATILYEAFLLLISEGHDALLNEWILLSIESFVQQEPEYRALWSITCLFLASSSELHIRSMFPLVCYSQHLSSEELFQILCLGTRTFYAKQNDERQLELLKKLKNSKYSSLLKVVDYCIS